MEGNDVLPDSSEARRSADDVIKRSSGRQNCPGGRNDADSDDLIVLLSTWKIHINIKAVQHDHVTLMRALYLIYFS